MRTDVQAYCTKLKNLVGDDDPVATLAETPIRLKSLIAGVDVAALRYKPEPDKWSITEIVAHFADSELVFGFRLRMIFTVDGTLLQAFDPDAWAATFAYDRRDVQEAIEVFSVLRAGNVRMLREVAAPRLEHAGTHEEWGTETARGMIRLEAGHDKNHLAQIQTILDAIGAAPTFKPSDQKAEIALEVAGSVDLRVGTIVDIVPIPDADRLMKLTVDFGSDRRTVIAGIRKERSEPRVLVGRQALFFYNLPRKTIRGHLSEAMLCDVGHADGIQPALLEPEWPVPNGTRAG
jgi:tRNA-binding protein